jgi:hypothetical protein
MCRGTFGALLLGVAVAGSAFAVEPGSPEDVLRRYLLAIKTEKFGDAYDLASKAMRQGKGKEEYVKESRAMMGYADVKIFDFTVYPGKVEGEKALVPNILESQDRFVNTLGLTEYELYTLVREDGGWKVDSQILVEPAEQAKWFPKKGDKTGEKPGAKPPQPQAEKPKESVPH